MGMRDMVAFLCLLVVVAGFHTLAHAEGQAEHGGISTPLETFEVGFDGNRRFEVEGKDISREGNNNMGDPFGDRMGREMGMGMDMEAPKGSGFEGEDHGSSANDKDTADPERAKVSKLLAESTKARVRAFYEEHVPERVAQVDRVCEMFAGREAQMLATLEQKYGKPVPEDPDHRRRLHLFYHSHAPDKVGSVDKVLQHFKGREEAMFASLREKYTSFIASASGYDPDTSMRESLRARLTKAGLAESEVDTVLSSSCPPL